MIHWSQRLAVPTDIAPVGEILAATNFTGCGGNKCFAAQFDSRIAWNKFPLRKAPTDPRVLKNNEQNNGLRRPRRGLPFRRATDSLYQSDGITVGSLSQETLAAVDPDWASGHVASAV